MRKVEMSVIEGDELVEEILVALEREGYVRRVMDEREEVIWVVTADLLHIARRKVTGQ